VRSNATLSVAICTHNRPHAAVALADSLRTLLAAHGIALAVVDSASEGSAAEILADAFRDTEVRLLRLDEPGVSLARNTALAWATSEWLAFLDDDEQVPADWVSAALSLCSRLPDDCAACGGNVLPRWPDETVRNIGPRWRNFLSIIDQPGEFDQTARHQFGIGHSIVRTDALRSIGGFSLRLGRRGKVLLSGEEALLVEQLIRAGWKIWHSDTIAVQHMIPPERLDMKWALERAYWEGISFSRVLGGVDAEAQARLFRSVHVKLPLLRVLASLWPSQGLRLRLAFIKGVCFESREQVRSPKASRQF
jgi:glycosyltransferase involved in cell wall biosynthesis